MQTLLAEVVDLRDAGCFMAEEMAGQKPLDTAPNERGCCTDDNQREYDTTDIHLSAGGLQPFGVPARGWVRTMNGNTSEPGVNGG